jgi:hypothetical protein
VKIEGYSEEQVAAICQMWRLGDPINVAAFMERDDIPHEAKFRVQEVGRRSASTNTEAAEVWLAMQEQVVIEVTKLGKTTK